MKIILGGHSSGKTKRILELSSINNVPILCESKERVKRLLEKAQGYGYHIPIPIALEEVNSSDTKEVYIDEIDYVFEQFLKLKIGAVTLNKDDYNELEDLDK